MMVSAYEAPGFYTRDSILGSVIAVACLIATVAFLVSLFRYAWRVLRLLIQTAVCAIRGEQSPWARRREEIKRMREKVFSPEEAIAHVRRYAEVKGWSLPNPFDLRLRFLQSGEEGKADRPIGRFVYSMTIGVSIPVTFVEIDATDGTVLKWHTPPR